MEFIEDSGDKYRVVAYTNIGEKKYLTYDTLSRELYLTNNIDDLNLSWQIQKHVKYKLGVGEPYFENIISL